MVKVTKFEDLEIWQSARELSKAVYMLTSQNPFCNDYKFRDQMRAAAGSAIYIRTGVKQPIGIDRCSVKKDSTDDATFETNNL